MVCEISWKASEAIRVAPPNGSGGAEGRPPIFTVTRWFRKVPETSSWDDHITLSGCQHKQNEELMQLSKYFKEKKRRKK